MRIHRQAWALGVGALLAIALNHGCRGEREAPSPGSAVTPEAQPTRPGSTPERSIEDAAVARSLLEAMYDGLLPPGVELYPDFAQSMTQTALAGASTLLRERFGAVGKMEFRGTEPLNPLVTGAVWAVQAEKAPLEMRVWWLGGQVSGLEFRPPGQAEWAPMPMIGIERERFGRTPAGW